MICMGTCVRRRRVRQIADAYNLSTKAFVMCASSFISAGFGAAPTPMLGA